MHRSTFAVLASFLVVASTPTAAASPDPYCAPLRTFLRSVPAQESRTVALHSIWGGKLKSTPASTEVTLYDMRCDPGDGVEAGNLCRTLIDQSSREFPGINVVRQFNCLSPRKHLPEGLSLHALDVDLIVEDTLGSVFVDLLLGTDADEGGYVIRITARR